MICVREFGNVREIAVSVERNTEKQTLVDVEDWKAWWNEFTTLLVLSFA